ncbi:uncharacterized protein LOC116937857 isoform X2 [Petromyzon marinus]|uniref:uncharacterized protein LOC116937857 isoform X2 n=1 Tax=Petromyzon marinus TaxID=7757 RepID=UPI003F6EB497
MPTTRSAGGSGGGGSGGSGGSGVGALRTRAACYTSAMDPNASRVSGAAERSLAYLWSCTLTDEEREYTIDSIVLEHNVSIRSICLGPDAKEEYNVVEVAAITRDGDETRIPLAVLRLPNLLMAYPSGLELNCPITVRLKSGSGPVYVCGQNVILDYDHDSEDEEEEEEEEEDEQEEAAAPAPAAEPEADEEEEEEEGEDEEGGRDEEDEEQGGGGGSSSAPPPPPPPPGDEGARKPHKRAASGKKEEPETKKKKLDSLPHHEEEYKPNKAEPRTRATKQSGRKKPGPEKPSKSAGKKSA